MIRSFQAVGRGLTETRIYTLGKKPDGTPLRLATPIPLMGMIWFFATLVCALLVGRILGISPLPRHAHGAGTLGPTMLFYVGLPLLVAYVMTIAEIEGRRVHVVLRVWLKQSRAKHYVGAWQPTDKAEQKTRYREIRVKADPLSFYELRYSPGSDRDR